MRVVSFSDANNNLGDLLDMIASDGRITVIHRRAHEDLAVISLAAYNAMVDTVHLLSDRSNRHHLTKSIAQFEAGRAEEQALITNDEARKRKRDRIG